MKEVGDMKDFALLIVVLVVFIYGYFLMEKLDRFLEENQSQKLLQPIFFHFVFSLTIGANGQSGVMKLSQAPQKFSK